MTRQTSVTQSGDAERVADHPPVEGIGEEGDVGLSVRPVGPMKLLASSQSSGSA